MTIDYITLMRVAIFVLSVCGFFVARLIYRHKKTDTPLVCPVKFDCHSVVHSDYSKFLGIPLEVMGMTYYSIMSVCYFVLIFTTVPIPFNLLAVLVLGSITAFLFSLYLITVQIFVLKKGCSWCFISAFICICIFILTLYAYDVGYIFGHSAIESVLQ